MHSTKALWKCGRHHLQWGNAIEAQSIRDHINEWRYNDSAGYSLPYTPGGNLELSNVVMSDAIINLPALVVTCKTTSVLGILQVLPCRQGVRYNYNTFKRIADFSAYGMFL